MMNMYQDYSAYGGGGGGNVAMSMEPRATLWMGDLEPWMDENFLRSVWYNLGEVLEVKMIRDRATGGFANYCFLNFPTYASALNALNTINGTPVYPTMTQKLFRLNWASGCGPGASNVPFGQEYSVFVGDLSPEVNDYFLQTFFHSRYPSVRSARVVADQTTGLSKGYGFVKFADENEQQRALQEMSGVFCGSRAIRVSVATSKPRADTSSYTQAYSQPAPPQQALDPNNTTIFVGGILMGTTEEEVYQYFHSFGDILSIKIPAARGYAFVQYAHRQSAEQAVATMNGVMMGATRIRVSWGRSSADRQQGAVYSSTSYQSPYSPTTASYHGVASHQQPAQPQQLTATDGIHLTSIPAVSAAPKPVEPFHTMAVPQMNHIYVSDHEKILQDLLQNSLDPTFRRHNIRA